MATKKSNSNTSASILNKKMEQKIWQQKISILILVTEDYGVVAFDDIFTRLIRVMILQNYLDN